MKLGKNLKFLQEGGAMPAGAPAAAPQGGEDPMAMLIQGAQQAVQAHAAAGGLRRHHAGARRRRAAHPVTQGSTALLHPPSGGSHRAQDPVRAGESRGARPHPRRLHEGSGKS